jgi:ferredoxin
VAHLQQQPSTCWLEHDIRKPLPRDRSAGKEFIVASEIRVNMAKCDAMGVCFEVGPDVFVADRYGYPIIKSQDSPEFRAHAAEAAARCPKRAIILL